MWSSPTYTFTPDGCLIIDTSPYKVESPEGQDVLERLKRLTGLEEDELLKVLDTEYGGVQYALLSLNTTVKAMEKHVEYKRRMLEGMSSPGQPRFELDRKPNPGEKVFLKPLSEELSLRAWAGDWASLGFYCFSFDFVDKNGRYIRTPDDVLAQIMDSCQMPKSYPNHFHCDDVNWETYAVGTGTTIAIKKRGQEDRFIIIYSESTMILPGGYCPYEIARYTSIIHIPTELIINTTLFQPQSPESQDLLRRLKALTDLEADKLTEILETKYGSFQYAMASLAYMVNAMKRHIKHKTRASDGASPFNQPEFELDPKPTTTEEVRLIPLNE
ncbi:hypothetical protein BDN72DRAFT_960437 [Pluteus cervinus]|uniref:Uncharacterized protein n=1 Tax=Pluteus cervinus TaxID=181527 RepID=A0ACD3ARB6_9AGAR|nr:hypothetical protein BDN72DRAFT_960437 [Pluteus cervinus]